MTINARELCVLIVIKGFEAALVLTIFYLFPIFQFYTQLLDEVLPLLLVPLSLVRARLLCR